MKRRYLFAALMAVGFTTAAPSFAAEQPPESPPKPPAKSALKLELLVLHATNSGKGIDPRIGDLPELKAEPFSSFDSYRLLRRANLPLDQDKERQQRLPNRQVVKVRLVQKLPGDTYRIAASISRGKDQDFLPLLEVRAKPGQAFIVAGQSFRSGILVLVFRILPPG